MNYIISLHILKAEIQYTRSQNTLHVSCQMLHVSAPRCHRQTVYQR